MTQIQYCDWFILPVLLQLQQYSFHQIISDGVIQAESVKWSNISSSLYDYDQKQNLILFNNKEILIGGKQFFWRDWFKKGIISIKDLLDETGNLLTFQAFSLKY